MPAPTMPAGKRIVLYERVCTTLAEAQDALAAAGATSYSCWQEGAINEAADQMTQRQAAIHVVGYVEA